MSLTPIERIFILVIFKDIKKVIYPIDADIAPYIYYDISIFSKQNLGHLRFLLLEIFVYQMPT